MQEPPTLKGAAHELTRSFLVSTAKVAAVLLGVGFTFMLFFTPACACGGDQAYKAAMKSDLRNLVTAQEAYFADFESYGASLSELNYSASAGVTVQLTLVADSAWSASAGHKRVPVQCTIFMGDIEPPVPDAEEGQPTCHDPS